MTASLRPGLTAFLGLCLIFGNHPACAGVPSSPGEKKIEQDVAATQTDSSPQLSVELRIARILSRIEETWRELAVAQAASAEALPAGITMEDVQGRLDTSGPIQVEIAPSQGMSEQRSEARMPAGERVAKSR